MSKIRASLRLLLAPLLTLCAAHAGAQESDSPTTAGPTAAASASGDFAPGGTTELSEPDRALTSIFYLAEMSSESGWEDVVLNPIGARYIGNYLAVLALSKPYADRFDRRLSIEWEGQVAYNFGGQEYWEFNAVPVVLRWHFPQFFSLSTTAAFGIGLSYTTELPRIEVELESESHQALIYWVMELTAGPPEGRWAATLRLHHRSVGYGLMGEEGGMNAMGLGLRYRF